MTILTMASSLAGRMETIRRPPPAQVELRGRRPGSSRRRSRARRPRVGDAVLGEELIETARSGGHPEPPTRRRRSRRRGRHLDYVDAIVLREVA